MPIMGNYMFTITLIIQYYLNYNPNTFTLLYHQILVMILVYLLGLSLINKHNNSKLNQTRDVLNYAKESIRIKYTFIYLTRLRLFQDLAVVYAKIL